MIRMQNIVLRRGEKLLFENLSFNLPSQANLGIVGANGCGKSSLFSLILKQLDADQGQIDLAQHQRIAHVAQETPATSVSALHYVLRGHSQYTHLQQQLVQAEQDKNGQRLSQIHQEMETIKAYAIPAQAAKILSGLGFQSKQQQQAVDSFSGGWRMRLNLAQALLCPSDLLLLDEPTNHLDLDAVIWLQDWIKNYPGTVLLISHDREFLDACVDCILAIDHQVAQLYQGNYSAYEVQHAAQLAQQDAWYKKQQQQKKHLSRFVERFRAKASKAKQAQSRLKMLQRMVEIAPAHVDSEFSFEFATSGRAPRPMLKVEAASIGYQTPILQQLDLQIMPGDRIGLLGANGAGKSTLVKLLAGEIKNLTGEIVRADGLRVGYFAQHQLEQLDASDHALGQLSRVDAKAREQDLRDFLGGFGFRGERVFDSVNCFSGGEKARLVLALIAYQKPNLLLLDEPTNHLDLTMRESLCEALQSFEGAVVLVSHDRFLLNSTCEQFYLVDAGTVSEFDGDLDDYKNWLQKRQKPKLVESQESDKKSKKDMRREQAMLREQLQPIRNKIKKLEATLDSINKDLSLIEVKLSDNNIYAAENKNALTDLLRTQAQLQIEQNKIEQEWLELNEKLE